MSAAHAERTRRMLYGRRRGPKLSAHQQQLLDDLLSQFALHLNPGADPSTYFSPPPWGEVAPPLNSAHEKYIEAIPPRFSGGAGGGQINDSWLEVGFGGGEHLIWQAQRHPRIGIIGAEPYVNGVVKLLSKLESAALPNIRIYMGDARDILEALPEATLGRVFILFPDPWPKARHHKRRFIQMEMLDELARAMKPGAELRFASDDVGYIEWTLERLMQHAAFEWTVTRATDWQTRPTDWPPTRYEAKQLHGKPIFLRFRRR